MAERRDGGHVAENLIGRTLGRYQLIALVGRGSMAAVYRATHPGLEQNVAVKVLHAHTATDPDLLGRFQQEARAVAALRHPNIVRVIDFDNIDDLYFIVMEYVDGLTLSAHLSEIAALGRRMTAAEVLRLFEPLCSAVDYAHRQGMVHCGIKPSNVLLTAEGEPVLTDYGIATIVGVAQLRIADWVMESARYASPEQAQGVAVDGRSDIYSLSVMLFESLAGQVPYLGDTPDDILEEHITAPVPAVCPLNDALPPSLDSLMRVALAKDPDARFQTGQALAIALQQALGPLVPASLGEPPTATMTERPSRGAPAPQGATRLEAASPASPAPPGESAAAHDVFISYAAKDKPVADAVCAALEAEHIRCWIAPRDVLPGQSFARALVTAIHAARVFVLVFSSASNDSQQVERELDRAVSARLSILPLRIEDVFPRESIEYYLAGQHWLDAITPPLRDHLARLTVAITALLQRAPTPATTFESAPAAEVEPAAEALEPAAEVEPEAGAPEPGDTREPALSAPGQQAATTCESALEPKTELAPASPEAKAEPKPGQDLATPEAEPGSGPDMQPLEPPVEATGPQAATTDEPEVESATGASKPAFAPEPTVMAAPASAAPTGDGPTPVAATVLAAESPPAGVATLGERAREAPEPSRQALHKPALIAAAAVGIAWIVVLLVIDQVFR